MHSLQSPRDPSTRPSMASVAPGGAAASHRRGTASAGGSRPVISAKGSRVRVAVRVRPTNRADGDRPEVVVQGDPKSGEVLLSTKQRDRPKSYMYDHVFTGDQKVVYESVGRPMLEDGYLGYNTCLFAYGQTGSGKTYSIQGEVTTHGGVTPHSGILPRFTADMLELQRMREEQDPELSVKIQMSYLEIYNEKIRDLTAPRERGREPPALEIREARENGKQKVYVDGLHKHTVTSLDRIQQLITIGNSHRQTSETNMNEMSSRSHAIVQFYVMQTYDPPSVEKPNLESTLSLVDLAGSERQSKTGAEGQRFAESRAINQSLLMLGRALNAFAEGGASTHVPLRDSKLTRLLSDCFGGNAKTWMLATVSPAAFNLMETQSTLEYASNAKLIVNTAEVNKLARQLELSQLREQNDQLLSMVQDRSAELEKLRAENAAMRDERMRMMQVVSQRAADGVSDATRMEIERLQSQVAELKAAAERSEQAARARGFGGVATYIGRAKVSLRNIIEQTSNFMTLPLFSDDASVDGMRGPQPLLIVNIYPVDQHGLSQLDGRAERKTVEDLLGTRVDFVVHIIRAKEIPARFAHNVYCKYVYKWAEKDSYRTSDAHDRTDPEWDFKKRFAFSKLNSGLVDYFMSDNVITFEVIGEARPPDIPCLACDKMITEEQARAQKMKR
eukprot:TRINITY_DN22245_c0_g1_i1.p1 TRINITY_DN22245_c0_g1~~TRINITY_DN22245_c0_g1_i1.p1  ORF type:complete len:673 (+),score=138.38 TRINITY_DN22245_c0_g1_i1:195-2213(+)